MELLARYINPNEYPGRPVLTARQVVEDEPTTALDVTTQAQILQLLQDLQDDLGMAIMYIPHDWQAISPALLAGGG